MRARWAVGAELVAGSCLVCVVMWLFGGMLAMAAQEAVLSPGYFVKFEVQGGPTAFFTEVSSLGSESEVVEQKIVGANGQTIIKNVPGRLKWKEIVLKRGLTIDMSFWVWRAQVEAGNLQAASLKFSITFLNASLQPFARWEGVGGWLSKLVTLSHDRNAPVPMLEELTIVHSGLTRTQ